MLRKLFKIIFYCALAWILVFLWVVTGGQLVPVEFQEVDQRNHFYLILFLGLLPAVVCTLFGTIRKRHTRLENAFIIIGTCLLVVGLFNLLVSDLFKVGRGGWITINIAYEKRGDTAIQIREQEFDTGAFGYSGSREVEVRPLLWVFWTITPVDPATIDTTKWVQVDKEGDVKLP